MTAPGRPSPDDHPWRDLRALRRFVANAPALRDALAAPLPSAHELMLHHALRRTMRELSGALEAAADREPDRLRAAVLLAVAAVAADLAAGRVRSGGGH